MRLRPSVDLAAAVESQLMQSDHVSALRPNMFNWSRAVRLASGLAASDLGRRLGVSQSAVTQLERSEATGAISIAKLEEIADALGCEFVYGFIPKHSVVETARRTAERQDRARRAKRKVPRPTSVDKARAAPTGGANRRSGPNLPQ